MSVEHITSVRQMTYGHPFDHFTRTTAALNAYGFRRLDTNGQLRELRPLDWPTVMVADKLARLCESPTWEDSWDDVAGYAWTARRVLDRMEEQSDGKDVEES